MLFGMMGGNCALTCICDMFLTVVKYALFSVLPDKHALSNQLKPRDNKVEAKFSCLKYFSGSNLPVP